MDERPTPKIPTGDSRLLADLLKHMEINPLSHATQSKLDALREASDVLFARMQTHNACLAMKTAFHASPRQLGKAAVAAAHKRVGKPARPDDDKS